MKKLIDWEMCEKKFVKHTEKDDERVISIIDVAFSRIKTIKQIKLDHKTVSIIVEQTYEVIKELLVAYLLKSGLRSKNHQCLISFFYKQNPNHEKEAFLISQMSYFRNRLNYYGESIPLEFYDKNKENFEGIIKTLKELCQP